MKLEYGSVTRVTASGIGYLASLTKQSVVRFALSAVQDSATIKCIAVIVEYEFNPELRDTEQVPMHEDGGIKAFIRRGVLLYTSDKWVKKGPTKIGYVISFARNFYKPQPLRSLEEITVDTLAIEQETEGLLDGPLKGGR